MEFLIIFHTSGSRLMIKMVKHPVSYQNSVTTITKEQQKGGKLLVLKSNFIILKAWIFEGDVANLSKRQIRRLLLLFMMLFRYRWR